MAARTGQFNERIERGAKVREINQGYQSERENGREWMRRIQYQIDRIVREAAERALTRPDAAAYCVRSWSLSNTLVHYARGCPGDDRGLAKGVQ